MRSLRVLLLLLIAAVVAVPVAGAKSPPARCAKGKVRVTAGGPCIKLDVRYRASATGPDVTDPRAAKRFRRLAGRRGVARAAALAKAARAAAKLPATKATAVAARRPRAHAAEVDQSDWEPTVLDGHQGRVRTTEDHTEGENPTQVTRVEAEFAEIVGGATVTVTSDVTRTLRLSNCPDANGKATALVEIASVERREVAKAGRSASTETRTTVRAEITVQLGDDAKIASASYKGSLDFEGRSAGTPTQRYISTWTRSMPTPSQPAADLIEEARRDSATALAGVYRGPHGGLTGDELTQLALLRLGKQYLLEDQVRDMLKLMELSYDEIGRCVDMVVDPPSATLAAGQQQTFTVLAKAKDGTPLGGAATAIALDADVTPATFTMTPGAPFALTFTMGQRDKATLQVEVHSKRGGGAATLTIPRAKTGWDITYTGNGTYTRHRAHGDTDDESVSLNWKATYANIRFDGGQYDPFAKTVLGGLMRENGTLGTGTYSCSTGAEGQGGAILPDAAAAAGSMTYLLRPFVVISPDMASEECKREGYGGNYGNVEAIGNTEPFAARITLTPELLARDEFTIPVTARSAEFPANCGEDASVTCTETGDVTGTVRFVRVS